MALEIGIKYSLVIRKEAVRVAINDIKYRMKLIYKVNTKGRNKLIKMLAAQNSYTIVAYPVVNHFNIFSKGEYLLKNKICFELDIEGESYVI